MQMLTRASAVGIILFSIVLAGLIGARIDQNTIAILGATFVGLFIALPTAAALAYVALRARTNGGGGGGGGYPQPGYMDEAKVRRMAMQMWQDDLRAQRLTQQQERLMQTQAQPWNIVAPQPPQETQPGIYPGPSPAQLPPARRQWLVVGSDGTTDSGGDF
jgi:hypothetical protein